MNRNERTIESSKNDHSRSLSWPFEPIQTSITSFLYPIKHILWTSSQRPNTFAITQCSNLHKSSTRGNRRMGMSIRMAYGLGLGLGIGLGLGLWQGARSNGAKRFAPAPAAAPTPTAPQTCLNWGGSHKVGAKAGIGITAHLEKILATGLTPWTTKYHVFKFYYTLHLANV